MTINKNLEKFRFHQHTGYGKKSKTSAIVEILGSYEINLFYLLLGCLFLFSERVDYNKQRVVG